MRRLWGHGLCRMSVLLVRSCLPQKDIRACGEYLSASMLASEG